MRYIVEELRKQMKDWITGVPYWYALRDAADEIERLQAVLGAARGASEMNGNHRPWDRRLRDAIRSYDGGREPTFCPQCGPDVEICDEGCCLTCGNGATGEGAELFARLQAVVDAAREVNNNHLVLAGSRGHRLGCECGWTPDGEHCCRTLKLAFAELDGALHALDGEVKP